MATRKNYRDLTGGEKQQLVTALTVAKLMGVVDRFAGIHSVFFTWGMHHTSHFFPWHRRFISLFEKQLQKFVPGVVLPYWDSTVDQSPSDPLWDQNFMGQFNSAWNLRRWLEDGASLPREVRELLGIRDEDIPRLAGPRDLTNHFNRATTGAFVEQRRGLTTIHPINGSAEP
jgi:Common central domain of tyrosinase